MKTRINLASTLLGIIFLSIKLSILYLICYFSNLKIPVLAFIGFYFLISAIFAAITYLIWSDVDPLDSKTRDDSDVWKEKYLNTYVLQFFIFPIICSFFIIWEWGVKAWEYYVED